MKIALFGGTFDPVHTGHTGLARAVIAGGYAEKVLFVPAYRPPHKENQPVTKYEDRAAMLRLALAEEDGFEADELEKGRPGKSFTIDTLKILSTKYGTGSILLLIGSDSLRQLHTWHRAREIAEGYRVLSYPRAGEIPDKRELLEHWPEELAERLLSGLLPPECSLPGASTQIRDWYASGEREKASALLAPAVSDYVERHGLYVSGLK